MREKERQRLNIFLPQNIFEEVRKISEEEDVSAVNVIREAVRFTLEMRRLAKEGYYLTKIVDEGQPTPVIPLELLIK